MKKKVSRFVRILAGICTGIYLMASLSLQTLAATDIDMSWDGTGSLTVVLQEAEKGIGIADAEFMIFQVRELVKEDDGALKWKLTEDFENCGIELDNLTADQSNQAAKELTKYAVGNLPAGITKITDQNGKVVYQALDFGTYLVVSSNISEEYYAVDPFLVSVPIADENDDYWYHVTALPKTERVPTPTPEPTPTPTPTPEPTPTSASTPTQTPEQTSMPEGKLPQTGQAGWLTPILFVVSLLVFVTGWVTFRKKIGKFLIIGGVLIFTGMLGVAGFQYYEKSSSEEAVVEMAIAYETAIQKVADNDAVIIRPAEILDQTAEVSMPYIEVENEACIGVISIPAIDIAVPVNNDCTSAALKKMPCRYVGDVQGNSLVIAAHNYQRHFGRISLLQAGDEVVFTDVDGQEYRYEVTGTEILGAYDVEKMVTGDWDLTLFTCTYGGQKRVTVRCSLQDYCGEIAVR